MSSRRVDFAELKTKTQGKFPAVLAHYGLKPIGSGDQVRIKCPFHNDEKPSCSVNYAEGVFNCKAGTCAVSGDLLTFVHQMEARKDGRTTLPEAGRLLATICGINPDSCRGSQEPRSDAEKTKTTRSPSGVENRALGAPVAKKEPVEKVNRPLGFTITPRHHTYVDERGIPPALAELFGLTFADRGVMAGRLGIPIHNADGKLVAYAGRWVGADETIPEGEEKYKLPAGFHKNVELFNIHRVLACKHLVVVEGYFGVIRLHGLRIPSVALMGSSVSDEQMALLRDRCTSLRFVTVLLDGDEAGRKASEVVAGRLAWHFGVRIGALPEGLEPDTAPEEVVRSAIGRNVER